MSTDEMVEIIAWRCGICGAWCDLERGERGGYQPKHHSSKQFSVVPASYVRGKRLKCSNCGDYRDVLVATIPATGPMR